MPTAGASPATKGPNSGETTTGIMLGPTMSGMLPLGEPEVTGVPFTVTVALESSTVGVKVMVLVALETSCV